jgi:hypothetical protein
VAPIVTDAAVLQQILYVVPGAVFIGPWRLWSGSCTTAFVIPEFEMAVDVPDAARATPGMPAATVPPVHRLTVVAKGAVLVLTVQTGQVEAESTIRSRELSVEPVSWILQVDMPLEHICVFWPVVIAAAPTPYLGRLELCAP